jgi:hypothetical protein
VIRHFLFCIICEPEVLRYGQEIRCHKVWKSRFFPAPPKRVLSAFEGVVRIPIYPVVIFRQLVQGEGTDKLITWATENQPNGFKPRQPFCVAFDGFDI